MIFFVTCQHLNRKSQKMSKINNFDFNINGQHFKIHGMTNILSIKNIKKFQILFKFYVVVQSLDMSCWYQFMNNKA